MVFCLGETDGQASLFLQAPAEIPDRLAYLIQVPSGENLLGLSVEVSGLGDRRSDAAVCSRFGEYPVQEFKGFVGLVAPQEGSCGSEPGSGRLRLDQERPPERAEGLRRLLSQELGAPQRFDRLGIARLKLQRQAGQALGFVRVAALGQQVGQGY